MTKIDAKGLDARALGDAVRSGGKKIEISNCLGQRFIAAGLSETQVTILGTPGNALGAYLDGAHVTVRGNGQDAVGDTMNDGHIIIHGNTGDAAGYAMRGGEIYVHGSAGYRAGIHMKEYKEKKPVMVIGGSCGSFLGEYQAGGLIIVLGLDKEDGDRTAPVGYFCGTGMHGGKIFLRCTPEATKLPPQVSARSATAEDMREITEYIENFCNYFGEDKDAILASCFCVLTPNSSNPYKQMYVQN